MSDLRKLAEAATLGPWTEGYWDGLWHVESPEILVVQDVEPVYDKAQAGRNAAYIAAANPKAILELLDDVNRLEDRLEDTHRALNNLTGFVLSERGCRPSDYNVYHEAVSVLIRNRAKLGCDVYNLPLSGNLVPFERQSVFEVHPMKHPGEPT